MKTLFLFCMLLGGLFAGCSAQKTPPSAPPEYSLAGNWVHDDKQNDELAVMFFEPDQTGGMVMIGAGTAIASAFSYERRNGTILIKPEEAQWSLPFEVAIHGDELLMGAPDGIRFRKRDDLHYSLYVEALRQELQERSQK